MALGDRRKMTLNADRQTGCSLRPAAVGALIFATLSLTAIHPARAQAVTPAPADAHTTLTSGEAQRALDVLQDANKRDELIETLRSIVKVSSFPATQNTPAGVTPAAAADGFGADMLSEAS